VILVHTGQYGMDSIVALFHPLLTSLVHHGARGVQLFFMASALTLWLSMSNRKQESHPTRNYFIRRLFRIAPMYWLGVLGYGAWFLYLHAPLVTPANIAANFLFVYGLSPYWINSLVPGGWSITVEMLFYVLAPWLFTKLKSLDHAARFVLLALLADSAINFVLARHVLIADAGVWRTFLFFYFPSQLPVFGLGILLFFILRHPEQQLSSSTLLLAAGMLLLNLAASTLVLLPEHVWYRVGFVALALGLSRYPVKLLVNDFTQYMGKISFSLYVVHFAVLFALVHFRLAALVHATTMPEAVVGYGLCFCLLLALSTLVATFFYHVIEVPTQNMGKKIIAYSETNGLKALG
jgi:peptidoglycan/LPS O-acetylase OafA/YrhL